MTESISLADTITEKLGQIAETLKAIQAGDNDAYLRELKALLRKSLAGLLVLFERNAGLDAATADLYAAAAAIVNDVTVASQPLARKRRLLTEAHARFVQRISAAHRNERKPSATWRESELFLAA
jgi:hypothetical protein